MGRGLIPGVGGMTAASAVALSRGSRGQGSRRRSQPRVRMARASARRAPARRAASRKLKFGSPAWQKKYKVGAFAKRRR